MADKTKYVLKEAATLLRGSLAKPSAPPSVKDATLKYSATFGIGEEDFKTIITIMKSAITAELGAFTSPSDYLLCCLSGAKAAERAIQQATFDSQGKSSDEAFKIMERAEANAELYKGYAGILKASSKYAIQLSRLDGGKVVTITGGQDVLDAAEKSYFYRGAKVAGEILLQAYRRKKIEDKDGVTAFLQQVLFVANGERIGGGGPAPAADTFSQYAGYSDYDPTALGGGDDGAF